MIDPNLMPGSEVTSQTRTCDMAIRVCIAGATGWAGAAVTRSILTSTDFELTGAVGRRQVESDIGEALGLASSGVRITRTLAEALQTPADVLVDYTQPDVVKAHTLAALSSGVRVVVGTSGLTAGDYEEIIAQLRNVGSV